MGHLQKMNNKQYYSFIALQYNRRKEAQRGHSFQYYSEKLQAKITKLGYEFYMKEYKVFVTRSELYAKEIVDKFRKDGYFSRIICGYEQNQQRIKMFSIIYKKKNESRK